MNALLKNCLLAAWLLLEALPRPCAAEPISLAGEWRFQLDGSNAAAIPRAFGEKIALPETMDDAGLGPKNAKPPMLERPDRLYDYAGPAW